ncbi:alanine--tRNA ligase [Candidatus Woesearchaeota archaeon]|nr:alanine--tRNA ligase [Candidatus Woesearchaeota archaeon]
MLSDKEIKNKYKPIFWKNPEKYYATSVLKEEGLVRAICPTCKKPFWSTDANRKVCGDPSCSPGEAFSFIGKSPAKQPLDYIDVWKRFSKMFTKFGYTPIGRYPVVARWNPTMEYTNASIAAFQPFVISGEVSPPANPLVIPQFCLRFGDIDNVGITESHNTGFIMIGQHMFVPPEKWNQNEVFRHIHAWNRDGLGLPNSEITYHEDAWAGGGNLGCCMEFFSRGCELGNQVYMLYEQTATGVQDLKIKVLDMGMGMERNAWFSQGNGTIYDAAFGPIVKDLLKTTGVAYDEKLMQRYIPHAGRLNVDEVGDIEKAWKDVAKKTGVDVKELREKILPLSGVHSIAEHSRSLLFALNDGALPSNVGGGYNLRILARRIFSFLEHYKWNIHIPHVMEAHAKYLKPIFPELSEHLEDVHKIMDVEYAKFKATRQKTQAVVERIAKEAISEQKLVELYDSQGIAPELIEEEARKHGRVVKVPENFYAKVAQLHEGEGKKELVAEEKWDLFGVPETKTLYFDDWRKAEFDAKVVKIVNGNLVLLDQTYFYPTSGGQEHDTGKFRVGSEQYAVTNVFKQGPHILHVLDRPCGFKEGVAVMGRIDWEKRLQLAQHHTSTHIINAAAKRVLGNHINQAGAKKTLEKAHIDITHYDSLSDEEIRKIEDEANKIVNDAIPMRKKFYARDEAEKKFGTNIYQGGVAPGKLLRIVEIPQVDTEACGGTHLDNTKEAGTIKILKASKIQDGIVRLIFTAGAASASAQKESLDVIDEAAKLLGCKTDQVPARAAELFENWKRAIKAIKKSTPLAPEALKFTTTETYSGDALAKTSEVLKTQPEHVIKTLKRFLREMQ